MISNIDIINAIKSKMGDELLELSTNHPNDQDFGSVLRKKLESNNIDITKFSTNDKELGELMRKISNLISLFGK